ncbi:MAG: PD-(D/E)XK nuclease family protein, partial [Endomicrobiales bacterium]
MAERKSKVFTLSFSEDLIAAVASYLVETYEKKGKDLSRVAVVFEGKRPALFLKRELSKRTGKSFFPPACYSIDEFIREVVVRNTSHLPVSKIDSSYLLYRLAQSISPEIVKDRPGFSQFLPWASEISAFLDHVDREKIPGHLLENVQRNADIGYEVPENINTLLKHLRRVREAYHEELKRRQRYSPGLMYLHASEYIGATPFEEFDEILFCNFFYLYRTEEEVMGTIFDAGKAVLFFQGDQKDWPVLERLSHRFSCEIRPPRPYPPGYGLHLYAGFDTHSQAAIAREIIRKLPHPEKTLVMLPEPGTLIPLLSEISPLVKELNVSLGYPLKRSSLFSLLECVFRAQSTKRENGYYAADYLAAITHPLVKNLRLPFNPAVTRVLVHKIEEVLLGIEESPVSGRLFVRLADILENDTLYEATLETLHKMDAAVKRDELKKVVEGFHALLFRSWEGIVTFEQLAKVLAGFVDTLMRKSFLASYPLNVRTVERLLEAVEEMAAASFASEALGQEDVFKIVREHLEDEMVSFAGSPLKGLQVLGVLESRALSFENVVVLDANESSLPKLRASEPLIPREVMFGLGLERVEKEEEIQRYQFMRLIHGAKHVHLICAEDEKREKSRFIEELVWHRQKEANSLVTVPVVKARFDVKFASERRPRPKDAGVAEYLKTMTFSATRVNTYLECPMKFYFRYVLGLREKEDLSCEPEGAEIGTYLHRLLAVAFKRFAGAKPVIDAEFSRYFFRTLHATFDERFAGRISSEAFLVKDVIIHRMKSFLEEEKMRPVERVMHLEKPFSGDIAVAGRPFRFEARVDRIDRLEDGTLLIIDYKSGSGDGMPARAKTLESLELSYDTIKSAVASFQLPLYLHLVEKAFPGETLDAALYDLRSAELKNYLKESDEAANKAKNDRCLEALRFIIAEITDPGVPFRP